MATPDLFNYIAIHRECGCVTGVVVDDPADPSLAVDMVSQCLRDGMIIERISHKDFLDRGGLSLGPCKRGKTHGGSALRVPGTKHEEKLIVFRAIASFEWVIAAAAHEHAEEIFEDIVERVRIYGNDFEPAEVGERYVRTVRSLKDIDDGWHDVEPAINENHTADVTCRELIEAYEPDVDPQQALPFPEVPA